jgi:hypothetical protein
MIGRASPARTALVTPTVQKHSIQTGTVHNKLLHRDGRHESDHRHRGLHPYGQAAEIPRRVAPCPRDLTLERRGIGRDLVIENGPRSEDASSSGSGRNDPMHALQLDD